MQDTLFYTTIFNTMQVKWKTQMLLYYIFSTTFNKKQPISMYTECANFNTTLGTL